MYEPGGYTGEDRGEYRRRRRGFLGELRGLSWWQVVLCLVPLGAAGLGGGFIGATLGGGIGGAAFGTNATLARKSEMPTFPKLMAMVSIASAALGLTLVMDDVIKPAPVASQSSPTWLSPSPTVAAPVTTQTSPYTQIWTPQSVNLSTPTVLHATGAELHWPSIYDGWTPGNGPIDLEVYRGTQTNFTPSPATLIAKLDAKATDFVDTTAPASSGSHPTGYYYMVAVRTKDSDLINGNYQSAVLPGPGRTEVVVPATAAASLNSAYPDTLNPNLSEVNPDNTGHGAERAVFDFGPLNAVPGGAHISSIRLGVNCAGSDPGPLEVYALTRSFDGAATWNSATTGTAWSHPGGDYAGPAAQSLNTAAGLCLWDVTQIANGWTASPNSEHGFLLRFIDESPSAPYGSFADGSMTFPGQAPELLVTYTTGS